MALKSDDGQQQQARIPQRQPRAEGKGHGLQELISLAAAGADDRGRFRIVELAAEPLHVDVDDVGKRVVVLVPDVLGDVGAADDVSGLPGEVFEERVFAAGQRNLGAGPTDALSADVDRQRTDLEALRRERTAVAPRERAQAGEQLAEIERLGQVVVGAGVESLDP